MRKAIRLISQLLVVAMLVAMLASVPAFADNSGKPGTEDLSGASSYLVAPKDSSWLDSYETAYAYGPRFGKAAYTYNSPYASGNWKTVEQGTELTLLASERSRYLAKTEDGRVFWINKDCVCDHVVALGRLKTDNAEIDANGPCLTDIKGKDKDVDTPAANQWLDERVECYVYAPKRHLAAEMYYYVVEPTSAEAIAKGYDINREMGRIKQGTKITLLAHYNNRYLVKSESGTIFWMWDWCTSDTYVPYGEAK